MVRFVIKSGEEYVRSFYLKEGWVQMTREVENAHEFHLQEHAVNALTRFGKTFEEHWVAPGESHTREVQVRNSMLGAVASTHKFQIFRRVTEETPV